MWWSQFYIKVSSNLSNRGTGFWREIQEFNTKGAMMAMNQTQVNCFGGSYSLLTIIPPLQQAIHQFSLVSELGEEQSKKNTAERSCWTHLLLLQKLFRSSPVFNYRVKALQVCARNIWSSVFNCFLMTMEITGKKPELHMGVQREITHHLDSMKGT